MRPSALPLLGWLLCAASCGHDEPPQFTLEKEGEVTHVDGCNLRLVTVVDQPSKGYEPYVVFAFNCNLPESDPFEKNWSKPYPEPRAPILRVGDCVTLKEDVYCVQAIESGKAFFKATYTNPAGDGSILKRLNP